MKEITLSDGSRTQVDDEDYERLSGFCWQRSGKGYAYRNGTKAEGKGSVYMTKVIMGVKSGVIVDHIDRNRLNNQRSNLRVCTIAENSHNQGPRKGTSRFKGVSWCRLRLKWKAQIVAFGRFKYLGLFPTEVEAARAYDAAAKRLHGDFAYLNGV